MAESAGTSYYRPTDPIGRWLFAISRGLAILGGVLLSAMAILASSSIIGRKLFSAPIPGDVELMAIGTGLVVFSFLPWCQITRGNVIVDFIMTKAPTRAKAFCDTLGALLYVVVGAILTWRLIYGGIDMYKYNEVSITVGFPRWTTFPVSVLMMAFLVVVTIYTVWRSIAEMRAGRFFDE